MRARDEVRIGGAGFHPVLPLRDRVLALLVALERDPERRHRLRQGGDLLQEAAERGLAEWGDAPEFRSAMVELRRDGLIVWDPPAWPRINPDDPTADELFNSRDFHLTLEGRREARALAAVGADEAPERQPGAPPVLSKDPRRVMVVHGRNLAARNAVFAFLSALGLLPVDWEEAVALTGKGSPHNLEAVRAAMAAAQAVVVLLTAEDEARLLPGLASDHDGPEEREPRGRPAPT